MKIMWKLIYYRKSKSGKLIDGQIVPGYASAPYGVCLGAKKRLSKTTHRLGVLKVEKL